MELKQGTRVMWNPNENPNFYEGLENITGTICGVGISDQPILGYGYILELDDEFKNKLSDYPYSHVLAWRVHLKIIS